MLSRIGEEVHHQPRKNCKGATCSEGINRESRNDSYQGKSKRNASKGDSTRSLEATLHAWLLLAQDNVGKVHHCAGNACSEYRHVQEDVAVLNYGSQGKGNGAQNEQGNERGFTGARDGKELGQIASTGKSECLAGAAEYRREERSNQAGQTSVVHERRKRTFANFIQYS